MTGTQLSVDAGVATITLDEADNRNALSTTLVTSLVDHLDAAMADPAVRVVVVTNTGSVFCAGADLNAVTTAAGDGPPPVDLATLLTTILDAPKPTVARIAGHCSGGGVGLAAAFDVSVASADAKFGFTEVRIGVAPAVIAVVCLPKMSRADAAEMFLRGKRWPASRAVEAGLINRAVAPEALDGVVGEIVDDVVRGGPGALAAAKQLLRRVPGQDREQAFGWTSALSAQLFASDEAAAGMAAYLERRDPPWVP